MLTLRYEIPNRTCIHHKHHTIFFFYLMMNPSSVYTYNVCDDIHFTLTL